METAIRTASPRYAALTKPQPLAVEELQRQVLDKDSLLLEYSLGDDASVLFAVSQDSMKSYPLPKRTEIEGLARETYEAFTARNRRIPNENAPHRNARTLAAEANYPKLAARLSQLILSPAVSELAVKRLLIVADGDLLQIPFGAPPIPPQKTPSRSSSITKSSAFLPLPSSPCSVSSSPNERRRRNSSPSSPIPSLTSMTNAWQLRPVSKTPAPRSSSPRAISPSTAPSAKPTSAAPVPNSSASRFRAKRPMPFSPSPRRLHRSKPWISTPTKPLP